MLRGVCFLHIVDVTEGSIGRLVEPISSFERPAGRWKLESATVVWHLPAKSPLK